MIRRKSKSAGIAGVDSVLKRIKLSRKIFDAAVSRFETTVTGVLESELASMSETARHLDNVSAPIRTLIDGDRRAIASVKSLHKISEEKHRRHVEAIRKGIIAGPSTAFNFTADPGWQMLAPPYDVNWGTGAAFADKADGKMTVLVGDGFSAAGVGVVLSVTRRSLVRVRPIAPYHYDWGNIAFRGPASSKGGLGVLAYFNRDAQPFLDKRGHLWSDSQLPPNTGNGKGSGHLADTLSGDVLITMDPGNNYLVWTWAWGMGHMTAQEDRLSLSLAQISCRVPAIVVDAGPALVIR